MSHSPIHKLPGSGSLLGIILANGASPASSLKVNLNSNSDPVVGDDSGDGYSVGSWWINTTTDKAFIALDVSVGAAIWQELGAGGGSGVSLKATVSATAHGFTGSDLGKAVYKTSSGYALSRADSTNTAEVFGIIEAVPSVDTLTIVWIGQLTKTAHGLTIGDNLFLSDTTSGVLTTTEPSTSGTVSKPVGVVFDANTYLIFNLRGKINSTGAGQSVSETIVYTNTFSVGDVIRKTSTGWTEAQADSLSNSNAVGIVTQATAAQFDIVYTGKAAWVGHGFTQGDLLYLSASSAGALTATAPTALGNITKPVATVYDANNLIISIKRGIEVQYDTINNLYGFKNKIINGNFDFWQRGTSFTTQDYTADRWYLASGGATFTTSRQAFTVGQTDVPGEPQYYFRTVFSTAPTGAEIDQYIESVRTFAGQVVTVSFYAKASGSITLLGDLTQQFGTGGSPSSDVSHSLGSFNVTTSWQKFTKIVTLTSLTGKTIGSGNDDRLRLLFAPPNSAHTIDLAQVQLEKGSLATVFDQRPLGIEENLCLRYFWKALDYYLGLAYNSSDLHNGRIQYPIIMRKTPTLSNATFSVNIGSAGSPSLLSILGGNPVNNQNGTFRNGTSNWSPGSCVYLNAYLSAEY